MLDSNPHGWAMVGGCLSAQVPHDRLGELFQEALELPAERRAAFVDRACGGDASLQGELTSLLAAQERGRDYLEKLSASILDPMQAAMSRAAGSDASANISLEWLQQRLAGAYRVEREIGGGGMSRVFLAQDLKLRRPVVIKLLSSIDLPTADGGFFQREIMLAAHLQHPHIVPLLASESIDGLPYYTMPLISGESLRERLSRQGPLAVAEALCIWRDVLDAIAHAHAAGVVHRDIKPGNILLSGRHALVADFGIACAVEGAAGDEQGVPAKLVGTPSYMAPEQLSGAGRGGQSVDIYQAGLLMYEMLAGRLPFASGSVPEILQTRTATDPLPLERDDVAAALNALVMRCLERDPARRPRSAEALLDEIAALAPIAVMSSAPARPVRSRALRVAVAAAVAFGLAGLGARALLKESAPAPDAQPVAELRPSVAVMPLETSGSDLPGTAIADGMTQELVAILGRNPDLRVVSSAASGGFDRQRMGARKIAEALQVSHLLEGSLQRHGSRLRMQVRLVNPRSDATPWARSFDREFADVFEVQDELAREVGKQLAVVLTADDASPTRVRRTSSAVAYEWYLRGRDIALFRNDAGQRRGIEYLSNAIAIDPSFAAAHAGLAELYSRRASGRPGAEREALVANAWRQARRAVELDDADPDAHLALGRMHLFDWDMPRAETEIGRAMALDRRVQFGYESLARLYMYTGRPAEQLAAAQAGLESEPLSYSAIREHALALAMNGRCEESLDPLQELKTLTPPAQVAGVIRGLCLVSRERWEEGLAEFRWSRDHGANSAEAFLAFALARSGQQAAARAILADLLAGRTHSHGAFGIAVVYTGFKDLDKAFEWLEKSIDDGTVRTYLLHPVLVDLHRDARFEAIMNRLGATRPETGS